MSRSAPDHEASPASYADFEDTPKAGVLQTVVQFFAIPMLIVSLAVGAFLGYQLLFGGGPQSLQDFAELMNSDSINRRWQAAMEVSTRIRRARDEGDERTLAEARDERFVRSLLKVLADGRRRAPSPDAQRAAAQILLVLSWINSPHALESIRAAAQDPDPWIRAHAVSALGELQDRASLDFLIASVAHEDPGTRQAALRALAKLEYRRGHPLVLTSRTRDLAREALGDADENVRFQAAVILALAGDRGALQVAKRFLSREHLRSYEVDEELAGTDPYTVRGNALVWAIRAVVRLEASGDPEVIQALERLADDEYEGLSFVRREARAALRKLKGS